MDNSENKTADQKQGDDYAIICLILAIASFPLICTLAGGVLTFIGSIVVGILALKNKTTRIAQVVIGFVLDGFFVLICIGFILLMNFGTSTVFRTSLSPAGTYQIDLISYDDGALGGQYGMVVERASDGKFANAEEEDNKPRDGEEIPEAAATWSSDYDITWVSDDTFYALIHNSSFTEIRMLRVELSEDGYSAFNGYVSIDRENSSFDHYEIDGEKVYYVCSVNITNTFDEPLEFYLHANAWKDKDGFLLESEMISADEDGNEVIYSLDPGETETIEVVFCGDKGPSDSREEEDWLPEFIFVPITYNPNLEP